MTLARALRLIEALGRPNFDLGTNEWTVEILRARHAQRTLARVAELDPPDVNRKNTGYIAPKKAGV